MFADECWRSLMTADSRWPIWTAFECLRQKSLSFNESFDDSQWWRQSPENLWKTGTMCAILTTINFCTTQTAYVGTKGTVHNFGHIVNAYYRICSCPVKAWSSSCIHGIWNGSDSYVCPLFGNPNLRWTCEPSVSVNGSGNTKFVGVHVRRRKHTREPL